jgi:hypothetical protein
MAQPFDHSGTFRFKLHDGTQVSYSNYLDIPADLVFKHVLQFSPNMGEDPEAPGTGEGSDIEVVNEWKSRLDNYMAQERAGY